jgi:hypothetical protein
MTQRDRDQLVTLHKAQKKLITQREAAKELDVTARHLRRFVEAPESGKAIERSSTDCAAKLPIDGLAVDKRDLIFQILSEDVYRGFGPTLASEFARQGRHSDWPRSTAEAHERSGPVASPAHEDKAHVWRERRMRFGELVQWDMSDHDWLEGRGPRLYLIQCRRCKQPADGTLCTARLERGDRCGVRAVASALRAMVAPDV